MGVSRAVIFKIVEVVIAVVCVIIYDQEMYGWISLEALSAVGFCGYIIILAGSLIGFFMTKPINQVVDIFFCVVGCAVFVAAGALIIKKAEAPFFKTLTESKTLDYYYATGSLAIIGGIIFLADAVLNWMGEVDD